MKDIQNIIKEIPPEYQEEVLDFIAFLQKKARKRKYQRLSLDWAGGLRDYKDQFTSLELQKKTLRWWSE